MSPATPRGYHHGELREALVRAARELIAERGLAAFSVLYGLFSGSLVSLPPAAVARLTDDLSRVGTRLGMCFALAAFGLLIGNPVAGVLVDLRTGDFSRAQIFNGCIVLGAAAFIWGARVAKAGWSLTAKI